MTEKPEMPDSPSTAPCPECGTPARQHGQSFCDSCGAFLRWDTPAAPAGTGPAAPSDDPVPDLPPGSARDHAREGSVPGASATTVPLPTAAPGEPAQPPHAPHAPHQQQPAGNYSDSGQPRQDDQRPPSGHSDTAIRSLLVPVPESEPVARPEAPGGVLPGRPEAARPRVRQAAVPAEPESGMPCPGCGVPNAPRRHFCRSCATPLKDHSGPPAEGPYAGQRPRLNRDRTRWIYRAVVAAIVVGVVLGGIFGGPPAARAVQDHFAKRVPVRPTDFSASHSAPKHGPKVAFDGYSNTWWGTGYSGDSAGQWLQADFGQPTDLLNMMITPGTSPRTAQAAEQARPMEFDLVVTDSAGKERTFKRRINDGGAQKIDVRVRDAVSSRLVLRSAYGAGGKSQVAIAELEYFGRSTGGQ
ncbi:NADase-type glycan-binding domain-containing protein [Streptomyces sp. NPDC087300]|uniref:discoidin domain-containing protein n=1 Tax=Streptomyces sp. NPDC087300 TaxID=3365780 RepID=UPI0037F35B74